MQINPNTAVQEGWIVLSEFAKVQQNGIDVAIAREVRLQPHQTSCDHPFIETVKLPKDVYADLKLRSTFARKGCFASNGLYDSGYCGGVGLSIFNGSGLELVIPANTRVAQIIFYKGEAAALYNGQYQNEVKV